MVEVESELIPMISMVLGVVALAWHERSRGRIPEILLHENRLKEMEKVISIRLLVGYWTVRWKEKAYVLYGG